MTIPDTAKARILTALEEFTDPALRFPARVVRGAVADFRFIDGDCLGGASASSVIDGILGADESRWAGMCNLAERREGVELPRATRYFERGSAGCFREFSAPGASGLGWAYLPEDFALATGTGRWCVVWDKGAEIAVFATRRAEDVPRFREAVARMGGRPLEEALQDPPSFGLFTLEVARRKGWKGTEFGLTESWRRELLRNYGSPPGTARG